MSPFPLAFLCSGFLESSGQMIQQRPVESIENISISNFSCQLWVVENLSQESIEKCNLDKTKYRAFCTKRTGMLRIKRLAIFFFSGRSNFSSFVHNVALLSCSINESPGALWPHYEAFVQSEITKII